MTSFLDAIDQYAGDTANSDRDWPVATVIQVAFPSYTLRMWSGQGRMFTPDGNLWQGWMVPVEGGDGVTPIISIPQIDDVAAGTSAPMQFQLHYLSEQIYQDLKSDKDRIDGSEMFVGKVLMPRIGLRALSDVGDIQFMTVTGTASFKETRRKSKDGSHQIQRSAGIVAKNINSGRSRTAGDLFTYSGNVFRSNTLYGIDNDFYAQFTPALAGGVTLSF